MNGDRMRRRIMTVAIGGLCAGLVAVAAAAGATETQPAQTSLRTAGPLRDLQPAVADPTDGAYAQFAASTAGGATTAYLVLYGLNPAAAGETHGAHVHTGPCVAGNGAAA